MKLLMSDVIKATTHVGQREAIAIYNDSDLTFLCILYRIGIFKKSRSFMEDLIRESYQKMGDGLMDDMFTASNPIFIPDANEFTQEIGLHRDCNDEYNEHGFIENSHRRSLEKLVKVFSLNSPVDVLQLLSISITEAIAKLEIKRIIDSLLLLQDTNEIGSSIVPNKYKYKASAKRAEELSGPINAAFDSISLKRKMITSPSNATIDLAMMSSSISRLISRSGNTFPGLFKPGTVTPVSNVMFGATAMSYLYKCFMANVGGDKSFAIDYSETFNASISSLMFSLGTPDPYIDAFNPMGSMMAFRMSESSISRILLGKEELNAKKAAMRKEKPLMILARIFENNMNLLSAGCGVVSIHGYHRFNVTSSDRYTSRNDHADAARIKTETNDGKLLESEWRDPVSPIDHLYLLRYTYCESMKYATVMTSERIQAGLHDDFFVNENREKEGRMIGKGPQIMMSDKINDMCMSLMRTHCNPRYKMTTLLKNHAERMRNASKFSSSLEMALF